MSSCTYEMVNPSSYLREMVRTYEEKEDGYPLTARKQRTGIFKRYTDQSFLEYLNDVRVMHLCDELKHSEDTIANLMEKQLII